MAARDAAELDDPIGTKHYEALCECFKKKHNFNIPMSWVWTESIISRCFRTLQLRRVDRELSPYGQLKMYQTGDEIQTILSTTQGATQQLAPGVSFRVQGQKPPERPRPTMYIQDCWQYFWALTFWAHSFAISGCYPVDKAVPAGSYEVELDDLLAHTAQAAAFVMKHLFGKSGHLSKEKTFTELRRHDESIRALWGASFRENSTLTFSQCIKLDKVVAFAERSWDTDYSMYKQQLALCNATTSKAAGAPPRGLPRPGAPDSPSKRRRDRQKRNRGSRSTGRGRSGDRGRDKRSRSRSRRGERKRSRNPKPTPSVRSPRLRKSSATRPPSG